ncbi:MAG: helix-turn-helix domain-containing protein [Isosphaeraceae bacterium]
MTRDHCEQTHRARDKRPFPWRCPNCGQKEVHLSSQPHEAEVKHDGRLYKLYIPSLHAPRCRACGDVLFDESADEQVNEALRLKLGLLAPEDILREVHRLGLSQRQLARELGIAEETLSRWVNGAQIQSKSMNASMRRYFDAKNSSRPATFEVTRAASVQSWCAMFPSVRNMEEVVEYSTSVAARGQLVPLGSV